MEIKKKSSLMRKAFAILLAIAVLMAFSPVAFAATTYNVLTLDKTTIKPGETVNLKVTLPTVTDDIGAITVDLRFDNSKLTVTDMKVASSIPYGTKGYSASVASNTVKLANQNGQIAANAYYTYNTLKPSGIVLLDVTFTAKAGAIGDAGIYFDIFQMTKVDTKTGKTVYVVNKSDLKKLPTLTIGEPSTSGSGSTSGGSGSSQGKTDGTSTDTGSGDAVDKTDEAATAALTKSIQATKIKASSKVVKVKGKKAIKITWKTTSGLKKSDFDGYAIYKSVKKNSGYGKKAYATKKGTLSYTNTKGLKAGKTYYYKVRAYKLVDGKKVYTGYSTKTWKKIKK